MIQEKKRVITTKNDDVKLTSFYGNGEQVIPIYTLKNHLIIYEWYDICTMFTRL